MGLAQTQHGWEVWPVVAGARRFATVLVTLCSSLLLEEHVSRKSVNSVSTCRHFSFLSLGGVGSPNKGSGVVQSIKPSNSKSGGCRACKPNRVSHLISYSEEEQHSDTKIMWWAARIIEKEHGARNSYCRVSKEWNLYLVRAFFVWLHNVNCHIQCLA